MSKIPATDAPPEQAQGLRASGQYNFEEEAANQECNARTPWRAVVQPQFILLS